jgi:hypothetical protein
MYRGSRKHVLDWVERPDFLPELLGLVLPLVAKVTPSSKWMPRSYREPDEAQLEDFGPLCDRARGAWGPLRRWWLQHEEGANTPNWDIALWCELEGKPGLILVEAKANKRELKAEGKGPPALAWLFTRIRSLLVGQALGQASLGKEDTRLEPRTPKIDASNSTSFGWMVTFRPTRACVSPVSSKYFWSTTPARREIR